MRGGSGVAGESSTEGEAEGEEALVALAVGDDTGTEAASLEADTARLISDGVRFDSYSERTLFVLPSCVFCLYVSYACALLTLLASAASCAGVAGSFAWATGGTALRRAAALVGGTSKTQVGSSPTAI